MKNKQTYWVDFPVEVAVNGAVAKVTFGIGDNTEEPEAGLTVAMPMWALVALSNHLRETIGQPDFVKNIQETTERLCRDIKRSHHN